jgi:hypothetical protein
MNPEIESKGVYPTAGGPPLRRCELQRSEAPEKTDGLPLCQRATIERVADAHGSPTAALRGSDLPRSYRDPR